MATTRLEMIFLNQQGKTNKISVDSPKSDLTEAEVQTAMEDIVAKNIFSSTGGDFVGVSSARVVTTDVTELIAEE
jgi:hypothetical protein